MSGAINDRGKLEATAWPAVLVRAAGRGLRGVSLYHCASLGGGAALIALNDSRDCGL
jgi:hypothetical protein